MNKGQISVFAAVALLIAVITAVFLAKPVLSVFGELAKQTPMPGTTMLLGVIFLIAIGATIYGKLTE